MLKWFVNHETSIAIMQQTNAAEATCNPFGRVDELWRTRAKAHAGIVNWIRQPLSYCNYYQID